MAARGQSRTKSANSPRERLMANEWQRSDTGGPSQVIRFQADGRVQLSEVDHKGRPHQSSIAYWIEAEAGNELTMKFDDGGGASVSKLKVIVTADLLTFPSGGAFGIGGTYRKK